MRLGRTYIWNPRYRDGQREQIQKRWRREKGDRLRRPEQPKEQKGTDAESQPERYVGVVTSGPKILQFAFAFCKGNYIAKVRAPLTVILLHKLVFLNNIYLIFLSLPFRLMHFNLICSERQCNEESEDHSAGDA